MDRSPVWTSHMGQTRREIFVAKTKHYINNRHMVEVLTKHQENVRIAREKGEEEPRLPDYIGSCILLICQKIGSRPNFSGYSFRSEMEADAILNCVTAITNFDVSKSQNLFGFLSRVSWRAFLRRIFD